jgi:hypothetical protein
LRSQAFPRNNVLSSGLVQQACFSLSPSMYVMYCTVRYGTGPDSMYGCMDALHGWMYVCVCVCVCVYVCVFCTYVCIYIICLYMYIDSITSPTCKTAYPVMEFSQHLLLQRRDFS